MSLGLLPDPQRVTALLEGGVTTQQGTWFPEPLIPFLPPSTLLVTLWTWSLSFIEFALLLSVSETV